MSTKIILILKTTIIINLSFFIINTFGRNNELIDLKKDYKPISAIGGNLDAIGSDTLNNLMTLWAESFRKLYPNVNIQIEGKGSSTAPAALLEGISQLGPMSRPMKKEEVNKLKKKYSTKPIAIEAALDGLAVFVHKSNPVEELNYEQLDAIFSSTYKGGLNNIDNWEQLIINDRKWLNKPIRLYGRNSASGTYSYFKNNALFEGDYKNTVKERPGSAAVIQSVSEDLYGIGYSGFGYITTNIKPLKISNEGDSFAPNIKNISNGDYPLSRPLYIYIVKEKRKVVDQLVVEFIKFVLSKQGQEIVVKDGYLPIDKTFEDYSKFLQ